MMPKSRTKLWSNRIQGCSRCRLQETGADGDVVPVPTKKSVLLRLLMLRPTMDTLLGDVWGVQLPSGARGRALLVSLFTRKESLLRLVASLD